MPFGVRRGAVGAQPSCTHSVPLRHQPTEEWHCFAAYQWDYVFDWTVLKYQQSQATRRVHREPTAIGPAGIQAEEEEERVK